MTDRYWITDLTINGASIKANGNPNTHLNDSVEFVSITFNPNKHSIEIMSYDEHLCKNYVYPKVKLIRDTSAHPSAENSTIGLACIIGINNDQVTDIREFSVGPFIRRSKNLRSFPNKLSFAGGLFDPKDINPEMTAIRELIEELDCSSYLSPIILHKMQKNVELTHVFFSHPVGRFNITFVYSVTLTNDEIAQFDSSHYQKEEVDEVVVSLKGAALVKSLREWTPNGALVILDHLINVAKNDIHGGKVIEDFGNLKLCSSNEAQYNKFMIEHVWPLYDALTQKEEIVIPPRPKKNGSLSALRDWRSSTYDYRYITEDTNINDVAEDMAAIFLESGQVSMDFDFYGYPGDGFDKVRVLIFNNIIRNVKQYVKIKSVLPFISNGKVTGHRVTCS